jgi:hypothetical protein
MPTLNIPDATYRRLEERAAALGTTVGTLALQAIERVAQEPQTDVPPPDDEWKTHFEKLLAFTHARADRYPPGFQADVSREAMYEGCGE